MNRENQLASHSMITTKEVYHEIDNPKVIIIDIRPIDAYNGWKLKDEPRGGHIKGAKSLPYKWSQYIDWIEIIQLNSFTGLNRESAVAAFQHLSTPLSDDSLREIDLFKSPNLENELSILISWYRDMPANGKSGLGLQLARAFSEFGYYYIPGTDSIRISFTLGL